jgi:hypothetical protein
MLLRYHLFPNVSSVVKNTYDITLPNVVLTPCSSYPMYLLPNVAFTQCSQLISPTNAWMD